jgi:phage gpG-like protein
MAIEIGATLIGTEEVLSVLKAAGPAVKQRLLDEMNTQSITIQNLVIGKLSGPVLKTRTGLLRDSITVQVDDDGSTITGTIGTNVEYAAIHEFGGIIHHPGGTAYMLIKGQLTFISNASPLASELLRTRPHDIPMPERSFLRSTLTEQRSTVLAAFKEALAEAVSDAKAAA